ncbi:MAG: hypothetical protein MI806_05275 [Minwuiales bacterium]|nr:hypothetical protein [Minwuiales bacterium]
MRACFVAIPALLASLVAGGPVFAQSVCGERAAFVRQLSNAYDEMPKAVGRVSNGGVLELLTSHDGTWTMLITMPDGVACVAASGEAWEELPALSDDPEA